MVLITEMEFFKRFQTNTLTVVSFCLTFLYLIELCMGVRTVFYVFQIWNQTRLSQTVADDVNWLIVVVALLLCVVTSCTVNAISAFWDSNNTTAVKSAIFYVAHILIGGILWRYVCILKSDSKESKKEQAMLNASLKFFFTLSFTLPLTILHIFLLCDLYELIYDLILMICTAISLVLTCCVFEKYEACGEYPYETMSLVPLLFTKYPLQKEQPIQEKPNKVVPVAEESVDDNLPWSKLVWKIIVGIQGFFFMSGRVLALGILFKLAGIYAVTIISLQILLSVLYLKFQVPHLVPETLSKSKQLMRLAFLSYTLVFEWYLHRDAATGYNLKFSTKHGMLYYSVATIESVFYLVVWAITSSESFTDDLTNSLRHQHILVVASVGCLCLLTSYAILICLILTRVESLSSIVSCPSKVYPRIRVIFGSFSQSSDSAVDKQTQRDIPTIDISSFNDENEETGSRAKDFAITQPKVFNEEQRGSYRDLREGIDEDVAIQTQNVASCDQKRKTESVVVTKSAYIPKHFANYLKSSKSDTESGPENSQSISGSQKDIPKTKVTQPKSLRHCKSTGNLPTVNIKGIKDLNFFKTLKRNSKTHSDKQVQKQESSASFKNTNVYSKMSAVSSSLTVQFNKLTNIKNMKSSKKCVEAQKPEEPFDGKISIPTISSEYKDELPYDVSLENNFAYRPAVPPRASKNTSKQRHKAVNSLNNAKQKGIVTYSPTKVPNNSPNAMPTSSRVLESKPQTVSGEHEERFANSFCKSLDCNVHKELTIDSNEIGERKGSMSNDDDDCKEKSCKAFERSVITVPETDINAISSADRRKSYALKRGLGKNAIYLSCPEVRIDCEDDVVYESNLCESSPTSVKLRTVSEGSLTSVDPVKSTTFSDSEYEDEIEYYI